MNREYLLKKLAEQFDESLAPPIEKLRKLLSDDKPDIVDIYSKLSGIATRIAFMQSDINPYLKELREGLDNIKYQKHLYNILAELYENYSIEDQPGKLNWHQISRDKGHPWVKSFPFDEAVKVVLKVQSGELII